MPMPSNLVSPQQNALNTKTTPSSLAGYGMSYIPPKVSPQSGYGVSSSILPQANNYNNGVQQKILPAHPTNAYSGPGVSNYMMPSPTSSQGLVSLPSSTPVKTQATSSQASSNPSQTFTSPVSGQNGATINHITDGAQYNSAVNGSQSTGTYNPIPTSTNVQQTQQPAPAQQDNSYSGLIGGIVNAAQGNTAIGQQAADIAATYGQNIADINSKGNSAQAGYLTTGTTPVAEGNAGVIAKTQAAQVQGQAQAEQAALNGIGYRLDAQGNLQSGLGTAAGYRQPVSQFGVLTDPATGLPISGGDAGSAAFRGGQVGAQQQAGATYQNQTTALQSGRNQQQQLSNLLQSSGIQANDFSGANKLIQTIASNTSDPRYSNLQSMLQGINTAYSQILGKTIDVSSIANQSGSSILDVIQGLDAQAQASVAATKSIGTGNTGGQGSPFLGAAWK